jgi:DNA ligase-1
MGIYQGDEIVPLVHVSPDVEQALMMELLGYAEKNTVVQVGPVRTLAPFYVFEIEVAGITLAPRRKCGVKVAQARIVQLLRDVSHDDIATVDDVLLLFADSGVLPPELPNK